MNRMIAPKVIGNLKVISNARIELQRVSEPNGGDEGYCRMEVKVNVNGKEYAKDMVYPVTEVECLFDRMIDSAKELLKEYINKEQNGR